MMNSSFFASQTEFLIVVSLRILRLCLPPNTFSLSHDFPITFASLKSKPVHRRCDTLQNSLFSSKIASS